MHTRNVTTTRRSPAIVWLTVLTALVAPSSAQAWTRLANFEQGEIGSKAEAADGFDGAAGRSIYTREYAAVGRQSAELRVRKGHTGFGYFGGIIDFPERLYSGDEVCIQVHARFPKSYLFLKSPNTSKFLRVRTYGPEKGGRYWNNIYMNDDLTEYEFSAAKWHTIRNSGPPRDKWQTYRWYIRFDDNSTKDGGKGLVRFWIDGKLMGNFPQVATLAEPTAYARALYVFTWWEKDGPPRDLHVYVDDIMITTNVTGNSPDEKSCNMQAPSAPSVSVSPGG